MAELDPEMVEKIQARARADREIVGRYNANLLREQGIEPNATLLQAMCGQNIAEAFEVLRNTVQDDDPLALGYSDPADDEEWFM